MVSIKHYLSSRNLKIMRKQEIINKLIKYRFQIEQFFIVKLYLFGSVARDEANLNSDVDLLVEFSKPVGLLTFAKLQNYLEEILGCQVDLGTTDSLKPYLVDNVWQEAIRVI